MVPAALKRHKTLLVLLAGVAVVLHAALMFDGFGEPDAARLAIAAGEWHETGRALYQSYVFRTSPLYIHGIKLLLDAGVDLDRIPGILNAVSALLSGLILLPLFALWRRWASADAALVGCLLLCVAPSLWLAGSYGMAHLPGFFLFALSLLLYVWSLEAEGRRPSVLLYAASLVVAAACVATKADLVLCFGAFVGVAWLQTPRDRNQVLLALVIPLAAGLWTVLYARTLSPDGMRAADFAGVWSRQFPFTLDALTDTANRAVLINSVGRMLALAIVVALPLALFDRRRRQVLGMSLLWALPPFLFWGLKLGNSARHMMPAVCALLFLLASVLVGRLRSPARVAGALVVLVALNLLLGPTQGSSINPTGRLWSLHDQVSSYATKLQDGGRSFAAVPVPAKVFLGTAAAPYAVFEMMNAASSFTSSRFRADWTPPNASPFHPSRIWPQYAFTREDGTTARVRVREVYQSEQIGPLDGWFVYTSEPNILFRNLMSDWAEPIQAALRDDPDSIYEWANTDVLRVTGARFLLEVGQPEKTLELLQFAFEEDPDSPDALYALGAMLLHLQKTDEAVAHMRMFLRLHPNDQRTSTVRQRLEALAAEGMAPR